MKKIVKIFLVLFIILMPLNVSAVSKDYKDLVYKIVDKKVEENKINLYLFHKNSCPHCAKEKEFLKSIEDKYSDLNIYMFEISNISNNSLMKKAKTMFNEKEPGVPFTVIGEKHFIGYNEFVGDQIEKTIQEYLEIKKQTEKEKNTFSLPILGEVNVKDASIPLIAIILGLIDGFNPCAMWVLLFLINMFFGMKNKKKMFILGYTFLFTSGLVYFLSMLGMTLILELTSIVKWLQILIALVAITAGIINIRKYITTKNEMGCTVVDDKKRKKVFKKVNKIINEKNILLSIIGVVALAISVNLVELACSVGFPAIFSEILSLNNINGVLRVVYLLIYVLCYLIDDLVVFTIAVSTLSISTRSTKYTKYVNLIAGIIMILMGILLIFKPEWVMLNF